MPEDYKSFVLSLVKPGEDILEQLSPVQAELLHYAVGVSGEAGELLDAIKKHVIYQKPLDLDNVIEELGDLEFFLCAMRARLCVTRERVLEHNVNKLQRRYPGKTYTNEAAIARADK